MMMPANFSAIAENEMTYVVGGGIEAYLAPAMTAENWKTFNTNLITIVGNQGMDTFVKATLGTIFGGTYKPGDIVGGYWGKLSRVYAGMANATSSSFYNGVLGVLNVALNMAQQAAVIYTLGHGSTTGAHTGKYGAPDAKTGATLWG